MPRGMLAHELLNFGKVDVYLAIASGDDFPHLCPDDLLLELVENFLLQPHFNAGLVIAPALRWEVVTCGEEQARAVHHDPPEFRVIENDRHEILHACVLMQMVCEIRDRFCGDREFSLAFRHMVSAPAIASRLDVCTGDLCRRHNTEHD